jgi:purine-binding chemotaxis protein CheW
MLSLAQQESAAGSAPRELVVFAVGEQEFCIDASAVKEIRLSTPTTSIPRSPPYVFGVINLRGTVIPIVDLRMRLDFPPRDPAARSVFVVVWVEKRLLGLLVDAVADIVTVAGEAFEPTPNVPGETLQVVTALVAIEHRTIGLLALDKILPLFSDEGA